MADKHAWILIHRLHMDRLNGNNFNMYLWNKIVKNFSANLPWNVNLIFLHSIGFNPLHWIETSSSKTWFLCISFWIFSFYLIFLRNFTFLSVASSKFTVRLCKFSDSFQLSCTFFLPNIDLSYLIHGNLKKKPVLVLFALIQYHKYNSAMLK